MRTDAAVSMYVQQMLALC